MKRIRSFLWIVFTIGSNLAFAQAQKTIDGLEKAVNQNGSLIADLESRQINCCDARFEGTCNGILKPKDTQYGLRAFEIKWSDNVEGYLIPIGLTKQPDGKYLLKVMGAGKMGEFYETFERSIEISGNQLLWTTNKGKKLSFNLNSVTLDEAMAIRPISIASSGPTACWAQYQFPSMRKVATGPDSSDYWCSYNDGEDLESNVEFSGKKICYRAMTCRQRGSFGFGPELKTVAGCLAPDGKCPPATFCVIDENVKVNDKGVTSVSEKLISPKDMKPAKFNSGGGTIQ